MGLIKEPLEIDFVVDPRPLTDKERKMISDFIKADRMKKAKMTKRLKKSQKGTNKSKRELTRHHKTMGLIKEPEGVDFVIKSRPLTKKEEGLVSKFIREQKVKRLKKLAAKKTTSKRTNSKKKTTT